MAEEKQDQRQLSRRGAIRILKTDEDHFKVTVKVAASNHFIHWSMALGGDYSGLVTIGKVVGGAIVFFVIMWLLTEPVVLLVVVVFVVIVLLLYKATKK